jgi:hypothetical protein
MISVFKIKYTFVDFHHSFVDFLLTFVSHLICQQKVNTTESFIYLL